HRDRRYLPEPHKRPIRFVPPENENDLFPPPTGSVASFRDPIDGRDYLTGDAHMQDESLNWLELVQHDREEALAGLGALRPRPARVTWQSFVIVAALVSGLWAGLFWMLHRLEHTGEG